MCDGIDGDCDTVVDEGAIDMTTFYEDWDDDGFGDAEYEDGCGPCWICGGLHRLQ